MTLGAGPYTNVMQELAASVFSAIRYVEETGSTNADAGALLGDRNCAGLTIVAEYQRHGTGRKGRAWEAAAGTALLFTTILPHEIATESLWTVPFWVALAIRCALREFGVVTTLQWPNDLLLDENKIAGVLCQSSVTGNSARVACGVGINVNRWADAASLIVPPPAFCDDVAVVDRRALLRAILLEYERSLPALAHPAHVIEEWDRAAQLPGRRYRIQLDQDVPPFEGVVLGLVAGGGLRFAHGDGTLQTIALGDARVLR